jgi:hypothetical protein
VFRTSIRRSAYWNTDLKIFGYWDDWTHIDRILKKVYEFNSRYKNYQFGDVVSHNEKYWKFMGYKNSAEWNMVDRLVDWVVTNDSQFQLSVLILFNFTLIAQVFVMMYYYFGNVVLLQFLQSLAVFVSMLVLYKLKK